MIAVVHATIVLERTYDASPARLFRALADAEARMRWGVPSDSVTLVYDASDFRVGGTDIGRCGPDGDLMFDVVTRYEDIVDEQRIVSLETVSSKGEWLSSGLITITLSPDGDRTDLVVTEQIVGLEGAGMVDGAKQGFGAALDRLHRELRGELAAAILAR